MYFNKTMSNNTTQKILRCSSLAAVSDLNKQGRTNQKNVRLNDTQGLEVKMCLALS